jgi:hypothetical protein
LIRKSNERKLTRARISQPLEPWEWTGTFFNCIAVLTAASQGAIFF